MSKTKSGERPKKRLRRSTDSVTNPTKPKKQLNEQKDSIEKLIHKNDDEQLFGWSPCRIIRIPER